MGSATVVIRVEEADLPPATNSSISSYRFGNYYPEENRKNQRIVSAAISLWQMGDHDRNGSPYGGSPRMLDPKPVEMLDSFESYPTASRDDTPIVPVIDKRDYELKKKTITVKLDDAEWQKYMSQTSWNFLSDKVKSLLPELANQICRVYLDTGTDKFVRDITPYWNVRSTVKADTSGGKAKTVYTLLVNGASYQSPRDEFPTQAEARAAGEKLMAENLGVTTVDVQAKIVREDNTPVVKIRRKVSSASAKVVVEYVQMKTETPRTNGWMVALSYHI